ncbi:uncharacterized protein [Nicotiana tomentosiformis]|uniref:uncharacterized protein n=1 Tax=Nicotiana tomentosiformis TaxID=4098 RepID=UPI00388CB3C5
MAVDFSLALRDHLSKSLVERLSALRTRIVVMAGQEAPTITRTRRKTFTQHGGSTIGNLLQALEDYLPVLLGLVKDGSPLQHKVQFIWINQEDDAEKACDLLLIFSLRLLDTLIVLFGMFFLSCLLNKGEI